MSFIKELYYGNVSAGEKSVIKGSEYDNMSKTSMQLYKELMQRLDEEGVKTLDRLYEVDSNLLYLSSAEYYESGFRDGARLMLDILTGGNKNLQPLIKE